MKSLATALSRAFTVQPGKPDAGHEFEFHEVCVKWEKTFGKLIWTLPYQCGNKPGFTPFNINKAAEIATKRRILKFAYLVGVLKKL